MTQGVATPATTMVVIKVFWSVVMAMALATVVVAVVAMVVPARAAAAVIVAASPAGATVTAFAERAAESAAVVVTPRRERAVRSFSNARSTLMRAEFSLRPICTPISAGWRV